MSDPIPASNVYSFSDPIIERCRHEAAMRRMKQETMRMERCMQLMQSSFNADLQRAFENDYTPQYFRLPYEYRECLPEIRKLGYNQSSYNAKGYTTNMNPSESSTSLLTEK